MALPPPCPVTASHSAPLSRSRTEVCSRKSRTWLGLALQHLLGQVVDDVAVVPGEAGDEPGGVVASLHRQRRQLQCGDPPFGASLQRRHVRGRQLQAHHLVEVRRSLVRREPQVGSADLDQLAACPQPGQRQRRVSTAGDHQVQPRRQVVEQERHRVLDLAGVDQVVVVEHQHDVAAGRAEVVEQRREHHLDRWRLRRGQQLQLVRADPGRHRPQRGDHVAPEGHRVVVAGVERQPRSRPLAGRRGRVLPATPRATWTCRNRPVRRRGSASTRPRGPAARSAADAAPGQVVARADRASSPARGFASASPVASVDLWSAHLAHYRARVAVTAVGRHSLLGPNARQCLAAVVWLLHHEETAMPDVPRPELSSHSAHPHLPPTDGLDELASGTTAEELRRVGWGFISLYALAYMGTILLFLAPLLVSLSLKINALVGIEQAPNSLALVAGTGALLAMFVNPFFGKMSDRTSSRLGMRRPWMVIGLVGGSLGVLVVALAPNIAVVLVGWCIAQVFFNALLAAEVAVLPDQVPVDQRGLVSGVLGICMPIASVGATFLVQLFTGNRLTMFLAPCAIGGFFILLFAFALNDRQLDKAGPATLVAAGVPQRVLRQPAQEPGLRVGVRQPVHVRPGLRLPDHVPGLLPARAGRHCRGRRAAADLHRHPRAVRRDRGRLPGRRTGSPTGPGGARCSSSPRRSCTGWRCSWSPSRATSTAT